MLDLPFLRTGEKATVCSIKSDNSSLKQKLIAFGVMPNSLIEIVRQAPLGGPLQIRLTNGINFFLGLREAKCIGVIPLT